MINDLKGQFKKNNKNKQKTRNFSKLRIISQNQKLSAWLATTRGKWENIFCVIWVK